MKGVILTPCPERECLPEDGRSVPAESSRHYRKRKEYFGITTGSKEPMGKEGVGWESHISRPGSAEQTAVQCPCQSPHPRPHCL